MVAIPVFMMLRIAIKAPGKLRFITSLSIILDSTVRPIAQIGNIAQMGNGMPN